MRINKRLLQCLSHANNRDKSTAGPFQMKRIQILLFSTVLIVVMTAFGKNNMSAGGAGVIGVENSVETACRHSEQVKSLVLLSGETSRDGMQFLRQASQLPELFVVADDDEYSPIVEAMELLYITASSPSRKLVHYSASHEAPWLWYEPFDIGKVPANGGHGTDLFKPHPELPGIIVDWFVTTLMKTPGHAPAD